jgi:hypothetical protein
MASISNVLLQIFERSGSAQVQVSYTLTATHHDGPHEQAYRELVQLVGADFGPGEDGVSEVIPGGTVWDGVVVFTTSQVAFVRSRERTLHRLQLIPWTTRGREASVEAMARSARLGRVLLRTGIAPTALSRAN